MESNRKPRKIKLERHCGCENCARTCVHNTEVCLPDIAKKSKGRVFLCNGNHPDYGKNIEV